MHPGNIKPCEEPVNTGSEPKPERYDDLFVSAPNDDAAFERLHRIVRILLSPGGCPWDREQTLLSLRGALIEETYECTDAITRGDTENTKEELGDLFLLATMMSEISRSDRQFTLSDVLNHLSSKLIRRHPYVFADSNAQTPSEVVRQWNRIKSQERGGTELKDDPFETIPGSLPPLKRADEYQRKAVERGFDWENNGGAFDKIREKIE